ncbi:hypothetical protein FEM33_01700 [Dyadobacter flavalbus]|uniref:Antirepressor protein C-terminal domain-containing protein n=1 Tax=Dyadobacter flavalbus TaxID=2579942 RepID=A0A5M8QYU1_9BACT|nr:phage regulatory protein/antirepressor Ant [Dyadobacter flavalbus]KAA6441475.1 hypothetical protein FEM33_01700 [Dyadobacter flavalbus]
MTELVSNHNGMPTTDSLKVAIKFNKQHKNVLRDIRAILATEQFVSGSKLSALYFIQSEYVDSKGITQEYFIMSRKGFTLLAMGFTGDKALAFKIEYIEEFDRMEEQIKQLSQPKELSRMEILRIAVEAEEENLKLKSEIKVMTPKVEYVDKVLQASNNFTTTEIADELGMSAIKLNRLLCEKGIQRSHDGRYVLLAKYQGKGYTQVRTHDRVSKTDGKIYTEHLMVWTEYGRVFLHSVFNPNLSWSAANQNVLSIATGG